MLEEFPALLAVAPPEAADLTLRIGVDTGAVLARLVAGDIKTDYNILGDSVNMAQRLQSNAPPGALVVGATTFRLTGDDFDYERHRPAPGEGSGRAAAGVSVARPARAPPSSDGLHTAIGCTAGRTSSRGSPTTDQRRDQHAASQSSRRPAPARPGCSRRLARDRAAPGSRAGARPRSATRSYRPWAGALAAFAEGSVSDGLRLVLGLELDARVGRCPRPYAATSWPRTSRSSFGTPRPASSCSRTCTGPTSPRIDLLDDVLFEIGDADVLVIATVREKVPASAELDLLELKPLESPRLSRLARRPPQRRAA